MLPVAAPNSHTEYKPTRYMTAAYYRVIVYHAWLWIDLAMCKTDSLDLCVVAPSSTQATDRIRGFLNGMRYINPRFTYLLTYLLTCLHLEFCILLSSASFSSCNCCLHVYILHVSLPYVRRFFTHPVYTSYLSVSQRTHVSHISVISVHRLYVVDEWQVILTANK